LVGIYPLTPAAQNRRSAAIVTLAPAIGPEWVTAWLVRHDFVAGDGDLRCRVRDAVAG
jgi:hypothetical protein